jgi:AcrR family transcriptional regulator
MAEAEKRIYQSPARQRQADETRRWIVEAARELFLAGGYAATTIDSIASKAGVSNQTVYAVFGSKQSILAEIVQQARFGSTYEKIVKQIVGETEPKERLRLVAKVARQIYESEAAEYALLKAVQEIGELERELEFRRYELQEQNITLLAKLGKLKTGLKKSDARDILWTLTGRDIYRMFVTERGWPPAKYQKWLGQTLIDSLIGERVNSLPS